MNAPSQAIDLIKQFEGCKLTAYQDQGGVFTCGWGSTGPDITEGIVWTQEQADARLLLDAQAACDSVCSLVEVPLNDNQLSAIIDWVYNLGVGALKSSTLLLYLNAGEYSQVPEQIVRWCHLGGKINPGLVRRRAAEVELWSLPAPDSADVTSVST